jgi:hypothetical protein
VTFTHRPAKREHTPLVVGIAGPTKSGKTYSAHRVAKGLAAGGSVVMINAEGAKGHQYADEFDYTAIDITRPYSPTRYTEALRYALGLDPKPAVVIVDSMSHMHNGPGGLLEWHEAELDRMAGDDYKKRERMTWAAWIKPKAAENEFIYTMLEAHCHLVLCFRAKEKLKIVKGGPPIELGWQPIAGESIAFETIFTLTLPPHSKGVPDLAASEMRKPFDKMVPADKPLDESLGQSLREWAAGGSTSVPAVQPPSVEAPTEPMIKKLNVLVGTLREQGHIETEQLYKALGREPVLGEDGELHWSPLRDSLTKAEAHQLIERLQALEERVAA